MKYFDSHSHYYDERFIEEREGGADPLISALLSSDVSAIINVGTSPETCRAAIAQAEKYDNMYLALGIHPSDTRFLSDMDAELAEIENMIKNQGRKCVCLGEIGLDYHYPDTDKERQHRYFSEQMKLAERLNLPVCIHDRDSHADVMTILREFPSVRGVLHSYSGGVDMARELIEMGYMISFSGTLTFTNARRPKEVAATLPHDRILIETDCPYLAPHPLRGTLNHSGNLRYTNATLAEILGITEEECAALTEANARRFFGI
jgi:TatD DNase family protein